MSGPPGLLAPRPTEVPASATSTESTTRGVQGVVPQPVSPETAGPRTVPPGPELREPTLANITQLERLLHTGQTREGSQERRMSRECIRMLQELAGILGLQYDTADYQRMLSGRVFGIDANFTRLPTLGAQAMRALTAFLADSGITLLNEDDLQRLARGEVFRIGGTIARPTSPTESVSLPSGEEIRRLQARFGIYIGVYEDGRVYISNRAGYLIQQLANNGINIELLPERGAQISNSFYFPGNMPEEIRIQLEQALATARARVEAGNLEEAIRIIGLVQNVIGAYRYAEHADILAAEAATHRSIRLTAAEWAAIREMFNEEQFRAITGATYAEFEELGLSLGELARWRAMQASEVARRIATVYLTAITTVGSDAPQEQKDSALDACSQAQSALGLARRLSDQADCILYNLPSIERARREIVVLRDGTIPEEITREMPDIADRMEALRTSGVRCMWGVETNLKNNVFFRLAALAYGESGNSEELTRVTGLSQRSEEAMNRLYGIFAEASGRFRRMASYYAYQIAVRSDIQSQQTLLSTLRSALASDTLTDLEKDLIRGIFIRSAGMTLEEGAQLLQQIYDDGQEPGYREPGDRTELTGLELDSRDRYLRLLASIEFAYPLIWRYRLAQLDRETAFRLPEEDGTAASVQVLPVPRPRTAYDEVQEERRRAGAERRPGTEEAQRRRQEAVEEGLRRRRLEILLDAQVAVQRLEALVAPVPSPQEALRDSATEGSGEREVSGRRVSHRTPNATGTMEDELRELHYRAYEWWVRTGREETAEVDMQRVIQELPAADLTEYTTELSAIFTRACAGVTSEVEDQAFERAVSALPPHREALARTARFLDRYGDEIMWAAAAVGVVAGIIDSAGTGSVAEGVVAEEAAAAGMRFFVTRYGIAALRGAVGYMALSGRILGLASLVTTDAMMLATRDVPEGERELEGRLAEQAWGNSIRFGFYGTMSSTPAGMIVPGAIYRALGIAANTLVVGGAAFNIYSTLTEAPPLDMTADQMFEYRFRRVMAGNDVIYLAMGIAVPGLRIGGGFIRGMTGFTEIAGGPLARGTGEALRATERLFSLREIYGAATPAFHAGDTLITGLFVADPFVTHTLSTQYQRAVDSFRTSQARQAERTRLESTPVRITPDVLEQAGIPLEEAYGAFPLTIYLQRLQEEQESRERPDAR